MRWIDIHTHKQNTDPEVTTIVNRYPDSAQNPASFYSVGIHPWHVKAQNLESELDRLTNLIKSELCLTVGECGLDKRTTTAFDLQQKAFYSQLEIARTAKLPVVIHCVAAYQEIIAAKRAFESVLMIIHGFSKGELLAKQLLDEGFYLSFGAALLTSDALQQVFANIPADRVFMETDSSDADIKSIYEVAAKCRDTSVETLAEIINANFERVFKTNITSQ